MSEIIEKASATEIKITKTSAQVTPLSQLVRLRASVQMRLDSANAEAAKLDAMINQAKGLGVVEVVPVDVPVNPEPSAPAPIVDVPVNP